MTLDDMPGFGGKQVKAAPIKRIGTAVFILDMGTDGEGMPQELRVVVDPALLDRHTPPALGDFYVTGDAGTCIVPRQLFTALFSAEAIEEAGQQPQPETGQIPDDALGVTTQSLELAGGVDALAPAGGGAVSDAQPQPGDGPEPGLVSKDGLAPDDPAKAENPALEGEGEGEGEGDAEEEKPLGA